MELIRNKFRGCLAGALIGDCVGLPFEGITSSDVDCNCILDYFDHLRNGRYEHKLAHLTPKGKMVYSDDTAMTRVVAKSLLAKRGYDAKDMASRFSKSFLNRPGRGYGQNVQFIFLKWEKGIKDAYLPAREQFEGRGSYGNGAAMRIAPVALFASHSYDLMIDIANQSSLLTHYGREGYNGALLQVITVDLVRSLNPLDPFSVDGFLDQLIDKMTAIERRPPVGTKPTDDQGPVGPFTYVDKLHLVRTLVAKTTINKQEIIDQLGHDLAAHRSVATAIYIFLKAMTPISILPFKNCMERTIALAIYIGGDVDTIGSMACAISGAYYGIEGIPTYLKDCCEKFDGAIKLADQLFKLRTK